MSLWINASPSSLSACRGGQQRLEGELLRADEQQQRRERRRSYHRVMGEEREIS
jgi:hypothetical protein